MSDACTVVTGAAGGIGNAVVRHLVGIGECVAAVDVNKQRLDECFGGNPNVLCVACDLLAEDALAGLVKAIKARFRTVKGFVHAAGFDVAAPLGMVPGGTMRNLMEIHAMFPIHFLGWLAKKQNRAPGASCVLISSLSAHEGAKAHVAYAAAKGAVEGMLRPAAAELVAKDIRLNAVVLGIVETEMSKGWMSKLLPEQLERLRNGYPLGFGTPERVAKVVAFLLGSDSEWITGQTLVCDGGHLVA